jgi:hypothetical protein
VSFWTTAEGAIDSAKTRRACFEAKLVRLGVSFQRPEACGAFFFLVLSVFVDGNSLRAAIEGNRCAVSQSKTAPTNPSRFELVLIAAQRVKNRAGKSVVGGGSPARISPWWPRE